MPTQEEIQAVKETATLLTAIGQEAGKRAMEFLTLSNGGGAVAALAFMGSSASFHDAFAIRILFCLYVIGLVIVGTMMVRDVEYTRDVVWRFGDGALEFYKGKGSAKDVFAIVDRDAARRHANVNRRLGMASLMIFGISTLGTCFWLLFQAFQSVVG